MIMLRHLLLFRMLNVPHFQFAVERSLQTDVTGMAANRTWHLESQNILIRHINCTWPAEIWVFFVPKPFKDFAFLLIEQVPFDAYAFDYQSLQPRSDPSLDSSLTVILAMPCINIQQIGQWALKQLTLIRLMQKWCLHFAACRWCLDSGFRALSLLQIPNEPCCLWPGSQIHLLLSWL